MLPVAALAKSAQRCPESNTPVVHSEQARLLGTSRQAYYSCAALQLSKWVTTDSTLCALTQAHTCLLADVTLAARGQYQSVHNSKGQPMLLHTSSIRED